MSPQMAVSLVVIFVMVVLFIIGRELVCWYWKLNRIEELLIQIAKNTGEAPAEKKTFSLKGLGDGL